MPRKTTPLSAYFAATVLSCRCSCLHGTQSEAQKLTTTTLPRSDASESFPLPVVRGSEKAGALTISPLSTSRATLPPDRCATSQTSRPSSARTQPATMIRSARTRGLDDEHRRADADALEEPLGVRHLHPDATVRGAVADGGRLIGPVDADAGRRQPHPTRAERVVRAGRNRLQAPGPRVLRGRIPPWIHPLDHDVERARRRRIDRLTGRNRERPPARERAPCVLVEEQAVDAAVDQDCGPELCGRHLCRDRAGAHAQRESRIRAQRGHEAAEERRLGQRSSRAVACE